ncbi:protein SPEC3-like [Sycon ciliatum]|uniref:protein SPEC3-like n=1 Tax=Sycon ciliatum TaxID=27933 RepID=UPI0031F6C13F
MTAGGMAYPTQTSLQLVQVQPGGHTGAATVMQQPAHPQQQPVLVTGCGGQAQIVSSMQAGLNGQPVHVDAHGRVIVHQSVIAAPSASGPMTLVTNTQRNYNQDQAATCYGNMQYVPALPMGLAIMVLILNILTAGLGTIMGGVCLLCVGHPYQVNQDLGRVLAWCVMLGFGQIGLALVFGIGWVWGVLWGVLFIICSDLYYGHPVQPQQEVITSTHILQ